MAAVHKGGRDMKRILGACVGASMLCALSVDAAIVMTQETWTVAGANGWTITDSLGGAAYGGLSNPGGAGGALTITGGGGSFQSYEDRIGTTAGFLTGDYANAPFGRAEFIGFQFYAPTYQPTLSVYFLNGANTWYFDVPVTVGGWNSYKVPLDWETGPVPGGWYGSGAPGSFISDLGSVDEVGFILGYYNSGGSTPGGQVYGLDDFVLGVPEPETYTLLGFALLSLCITFRRQVKSVVPSLQKVISG